VGLAGAVVLIVGVTLVVEGVRHKFEKYLQTGQMSPATHRVVHWLGTIGTAARGAVFALAGGLVIEAAVTYRPAKARGLDQALVTLHNQPLGKFALIAAALGLAAFGLYGLCEARWRKV
jgi:formate-dependent phosphoribosylglycinamide formyltransferase (GAR transformylase)